jgi:hypothetical protein
MACKNACISEALSCGYGQGCACVVACISSVGCHYTSAMPSATWGRMWSVYWLALAYQVTGAGWRLAGRLPSRLLQNSAALQAW